MKDNLVVNTKDFAQEARSNAWYMVWDLCIELGMNIDSDNSGIEDVLNFIRTLKEE